MRKKLDFRCDIATGVAVVARSRHAAGVKLFCFGPAAELQMPPYHESQGWPIYRVRDTLRGRPQWQPAAAEPPVLPRNSDQALAARPATLDGIKTGPAAE